MFYYEQKEDKYYIWNDTITWKFWPFSGVFVKNKILWTIKKDFKLDTYSVHKYTLWFTKNKVFVLWNDFLEEIL